MWSRPARGAWIEIVGAVDKLRLLVSRPARGAWIEMQVLLLAISMQ